MSDLTLEQAFRNAIQVEKAANRFYLRLAGATEDPEAGKFLREMAEQELVHAEHIEKMSRELAEGKLPERADRKVRTVETAPGWDYMDDLTLEQGMNAALEAENNAALYYDAMADQTEGRVKEFFQKMVGLEEQHADALRQKLDALQ